MSLQKRLIGTLRSVLGFTLEHLKAHSVRLDVQAYDHAFLPNRMIMCVVYLSMSFLYEMVRIIICYLYVNVIEQLHHVHNTAVLQFVCCFLFAFLTHQYCNLKVLLFLSVVLH